MDSLESSRDTSGRHTDAVSRTISEGGSRAGEYLSPAAITRFEDLLARQTCNAQARGPIVHEGDESPALLAILDGWACCYKVAWSGERQITEILISGDLLAPRSEAFDRIDYSIDALTPRFACLGESSFGAMVEAWPPLIEQVHDQQALRHALLREWLVNLGRRSAIERIAHVLCEIFKRMDQRGLSHDQACPFPLTQTDLAHVTGLTPVHVNRTLKSLREMRLISLRQQTLTIGDMAELQRLATFDPESFWSAAHPASPALRDSLGWKGCDGFGSD